MRGAGARIAGSLVALFVLGAGPAQAGFTPAPGSPFQVKANNPSGLAAGDLSGDGRVDLATSNSFSDSVSVLLGTGGGSFAAGVQFPATTKPQGIALGDLDGQGGPDAVVGRGILGSAAVVPLLGIGGGALSPGPAFPAGAGQTDDVELGDVNGDGRLDGVALNRGTRDVAVVLGTGAGQFGPPAITTFSNVSQPRGFALADVTGDGRLDATVLTEAGTLVVLRNNAGTLAADAPISTGAAAPQGLAIADVSGDGRPDAILGHGNAVVVVPGNGAGGFGPAAAYPLGINSGQNPVAQDLNADGRIDVVIPHLVNPGRISVMLNQGGGALAHAPGSPFAAGAELPLHAVATDLSDDAQPDIAVAHSEGAARLTVLLNTDVAGAVVNPIASFGARSTGTSAIRTVTVRSTGSGRLSIRSAAAQGGAAGEFTVIRNGCLSAISGATCTLLVRFTPRFSGIRRTTLVITDNAPGSPRAIAIAGTGLPRVRNLRVTPGRVAGRATVRLALPVRARLKLRFTRPLPGRLRNGTCVLPALAPRGARACIRYAGLFTLIRTGRPGANGFGFVPFVRGRRLTAGRYRVFVGPVGGLAASAGFVVAPR